MVVLSKLATDFYKSLGFKNRTTGTNFTKYVLQATANIYKTEEDLSGSQSLIFQIYQAQELTLMIKKVVIHSKYSKTLKYQDQKREK